MVPFDRPEAQSAAWPLPRDFQQTTHRFGMVFSDGIGSRGHESS
jgi:hypothetical protein